MCIRIVSQTEALLQFPRGGYTMAEKRPSPILRRLLRAPFFLLILFLFYLLGKSFLLLVKGFSLSLGLPDIIVSAISVSMLVFVCFIGLAIILNFIQDKSDQ